MPRSTKCGLCGQPSKTHRRNNFGGHKKGASALKIPKPRSARVRRGDVQKGETEWKKT